MRKNLLIIFGIVAIFIVKPPVVAAQGLSLDLYPPVIHIQTTPPSSPNAPVIIKNNNKDEVELNIRLIPIVKKGAEGDVELKPELLTSGFYQYYAQRIQFIVDGYKSDVIRLKPLEKREISVNINLSKDDPPGDFYYLIAFMAEEQNTSDSSQSKIPAGVATNLLLSVGPKSQTTGNISEFSTSFFKMNGPVLFKLKIKNSSKHLILPSGNISLKNVFGKSVGSIDVLPQFILADSERYLQNLAKKSNSKLGDTISVMWPENNLFGLYKATAQIVLSENGKLASESLYFFVFPVYLFLSLTGLIFVVLSIYIRVKKKI